MSSGAVYPSLNDRVVLVTGGGSGIGAEIVRRFAAQGSKVGFLDIAEAPSRALVQELSAAGATVRYEPCDLTDIPALQAAVARLRAALGPVTVLVNNAAHDERHAWQDVTPAYWDERIAVNLKHQFFAAQAVVPDMQAAGGGAIVNMGSIAWMIGAGGMAGYTAAKSAVVGLTRSLARDLGPDNIRVNCVAPGWIMTQRQLDLWVTEAAEREILERQCLKRKLVPADVARVVVFFASDEAAACTAQTYIVDGGWV
ncbi:SDR family NAD(P)-dependent oxidoreductase [Polymorphum gilvum]|uniref:Putative short-chain dehydrogenase/reductase, FabG-like protein n=1 Tax=Polymorphum gilvum (strain LMG 25793 / CGMCC 1.9160 / SL003B-26A1) TaxID=991905 RepID=F2J2S6_POLGS|nr:SDR family NAD(P)-dependent oxidoreductase [Polymorphum gilvum]ADZ72100.1 Putative short-chain dehydrogenase/reductase, FabG-like protein [Polymorphum gilvum SL003B-26A1]